MEIRPIPRLPRTRRNNRPSRLTLCRRALRRRSSIILLIAIDIIPHPVVLLGKHDNPRGMIIAQTMMQRHRRSLRTLHRCRPHIPRRRTRRRLSIRVLLRGSRHLSLPANDAWLFPKRQHDCLIPIWRNADIRAVMIDERLALLQREPRFGKNPVQSWMAVAAFSSAMKTMRIPKHHLRKARAYLRTPLYQLAIGGCD